MPAPTAISRTKAGALVMCETGQLSSEIFLDFESAALPPLLC